MVNIEDIIKLSYEEEFKKIKKEQELIEKRRILIEKLGFKNDSYGELEKSIYDTVMDDKRLQNLISILKLKAFW